MENDFHCVIAIDGPAASGKSSVARELARRLGFTYVNSGAMYRTAAWHVLRRGVDPNDAAGVAQSLESASIRCELEDDQLCILIDDVDPIAHLHDERVNECVSRVAGVPRVREILVAKMHMFARSHDLVVEGRDIGSVVFPDTPYKFYIDASLDVRHRRREAQRQRDQIAARDRADSSRQASPLVIAKDAHVIDSSDLTIEGVVREILSRLKIKQRKKVNEDDRAVE
jgi:CMP/dCMP kinase